MNHTDIDTGIKLKDGRIVNEYSFKIRFSLFFSLSFSSFGSCQLNWKGEYMKRNSWQFLQNHLALFYNYFIWWIFWMGRSLHQLTSSKEKGVLHLWICCRRKGKCILMFVWLIGKKAILLRVVGIKFTFLKSLIFLLYA